jgi:hypothetical protein
MADNNNRDKEIDNLLLQDFTLDDTAAEKFRDLFAYQGMDPAKIFEQLKAYAKIAKIDAKTFKDDMTALLVFFCSRGSKFAGKAKVKGRTKEEGRGRMEGLYQRYRIIDTIPDDSKAITLARISSVFPALCAEIFNRGMGRAVTKSEWFKPLQFPAAASLIPQNEEWQGFWRLWLGWAIEYDKIVNPGKANAVNVEKYAEYARSSQTMSDSKRAQTLQRFGINPSTGPTMSADDEQGLVVMKALKSSKS